MAKPKKKAGKSTKKGAKKAATRSRSASKPRVLTPEERAAALKPHASWADLVERLDEVWALHPSLRVPGFTRAKIASLAARADKAGDRERALIAEQERKLRPISDARILAEAEVWRGVLEVNAAVRYHGRNDPALREAFAFLRDQLRGERQRPPTE